MPVGYSHVITIKKVSRIAPPLELAYKTSVFPGGEVFVRLNHDYKYFDAQLAHTIVARLDSSEEVMRLVMITDAIRRYEVDHRLVPQPLNLFLPYVPYGRQDRVCSEGEAHSLSAFAAVINGLNFATVTVVDAHSDVTATAIHRCRVITQKQVVERYKTLAALFTVAAPAPRPIVVSPDAGSNKKAASIAEYFSTAFIRADKLRNLTDTSLSDTVVYCDDLNGAEVVIFDDICDGGKTFVALGHALKKKGAGKVHLYVTHGIFSKGVTPLLGLGIIPGPVDEIWTTDSFRAWGTDPLNRATVPDDLKLSHKFHVFPVEPNFL